MKNWMHTREWAALVRRDLDHQYHVQAYWNYQYSLIPTKPVPHKEIMCATTTKFRYPSIEEDPAAYMYGFD
jgi:hypothetical protein